MIDPRSNRLRPKDPRLQTGPAPDLEDGLEPELREQNLRLERRLDQALNTLPLPAIPKDFAARVARTAAATEQVPKRTEFGQRTLLACGFLLFAIVLLSMPVLVHGTALAKGMEMILCLELAILAGVAGSHYAVLR